MTDLSKRIREHLLVDPRGLSILGTHVHLLREAADALEWQPIKYAPMDGTSVLLFTTCHGVVEARFDPGYWTEDTPISPREYFGGAWVCADDAFQIEVELGVYPDGSAHHGTATHFMPLPSPPADE